MTRPSDRAIAQAFMEYRDRVPWDYNTIRVMDRARELDATAAPVVVGEVPAGHVLIGPNIVRFGVGNFDILKVGQAAANISKELTAAMAGD